MQFVRPVDCRVSRWFAFTCRTAYNPTQDNIQRDPITRDQTQLMLNETLSSASVETIKLLKYK